VQKLWLTGLILLPLALFGLLTGDRASAKNEQNSPTRKDKMETIEQRELETAYEDYRQVIQETMSMVYDREARRLAQQYGLDIVNVTWEDTGRYHNSAVGPNISDMTIQVQQRNPITEDYELSLMPVIRYPNFEDRSADLSPDDFFLLVGNEKGRSLQRISLREFLGNIRKYLSDGDSWGGRETSLLADRDTHVLVSAQACFLPIPQGKIAQFNPVLFNYQSYQGDPAVLTILATREGTSVTIIDNVRDGFEAGGTWGQRLFFNKNGERASLTGQRSSDFEAENGNAEPSESAAAAGESGLNMVLLIQVPLKQKNPMEREVYNDAVPSAGIMLESAVRGDVEAAVIGHGAVEGPFTEIDGLDIERHPDFPIRVTVQFYKATSNGVVSAQDIEAIHDQIARVYEEADYVGSLVVDGDTGRPTEYEGDKQEPPYWWDAFWRRYEANTGQSREEAIEMLRRWRGENWMPRSPGELQQELEELRSRSQRQFKPCPLCNPLTKSSAN
jgi:hypothetical protein